MWRVLGNADLDESSATPRQAQRRPNALSRISPSVPAGSTVGEPPESSSARSFVIAQRRKSPPEPTPVLCGKYRVTGLMRRGATGYLYSGVLATPAVDDAGRDRDVGSVDVGLIASTAATVGVVLKVEECAAPKRQMHSEWQVRVVTKIDLWTKDM